MSTTMQMLGGDVLLDGNTGRPKLVAGSTKLRQDLDVAVSTRVRSNGYGMGLDGIVGRVGDRYSLQSEITQRITRGMNSIKSLQAQYGRNARSDAERISRVNEISVLPMITPGTSQVDPTRYIVKLVVTSVQGERLAAQRVIK